MPLQITDQGRILVSNSLSDSSNRRDKWVESKLPEHDSDGFFECDKDFLKMRIKHGNGWARFKRLEAEYLRLLEISPQGKEHTRFFKSGSAPMEKLEGRITFLENEITKLKEELSSSGVDVKNYLKNDD